MSPCVSGVERGRGALYSHIFPYLFGASDASTIQSSSGINFLFYNSITGCGVKVAESCTWQTERRHRWRLFTAYFVSRFVLLMTTRNWLFAKCLLRVSCRCHDNDVSAWEPASL